MATGRTAAGRADTGFGRPLTGPATGLVGPPRGVFPLLGNTNPPVGSDRRRVVTFGTQWSRRGSGRDRARPSAERIVAGADRTRPGATPRKAPPS